MQAVLSIGGSDSGAGAGIQADTRTFMALGVYGCTAVTALTVQDTKRVYDIRPTEPRIVREQIRAVFQDFKIAAVKVGILYAKEIVKTVADSLSRIKVPIVIDPILRAGTGAKLLNDDAFDSFVKLIVPTSTILTPNRPEAEAISGINIRSNLDALKAARRIAHCGAKNIIIKGGHSAGRNSADILLESDGRTTNIVNPRLTIGRTHGTGCSFSAAATAFLAQGFSIRQSCILASEYVQQTLDEPAKLGRGSVVILPRGYEARGSERYAVARSLQCAVEELCATQGFQALIPETQTNFGYAMQGAQSVGDVAAVPGRIVRSGDRAVPVSCVRFGSSSHVASAILARMEFDPTIRCALNIKYDPELINAAAKEYSITSYDRSKEPSQIKAREGATVGWGVRNALSKNPDVQLIYHTGAIGKEPMTIIFGANPKEAIAVVKRLLELY